MRSWEAAMLSWCHTVNEYNVSEKFLAADEVVVVFLEVEGIESLFFKPSLDTWAGFWWKPWPLVRGRVPQAV